LAAARVPERLRRTVRGKWSGEPIDDGVVQREGCAAYQEIEVVDGDPTTGERRLDLAETVHYRARHIDNRIELREAAR
jgi:hypothetical protein